MDTNFEGFVPIHTVFYSIFHPTEGSKVCYQFPPENLNNYSINFDAIKNFIIPKPQLCHRLLTFKYGIYRIVSYPVTVNSALYARNFFSFNFVFVFPYECETSPYEPAIGRLGKMFRVLEEQKQILSRAEKDELLFKGEIPNILDENEFSIRDLLMRIYQDLNNYSECLIPIDNGNAVDIKIFPLLKPPNSVQVSVEDVPMSIVEFSKIVDVNWDPTLLNILPFINGLNNISNISKLSDSDPNLVIECIKHLIYYKCVIITDFFQFSNIYAPTSLISLFLTEPTMAYDCQAYVTLPPNSRINYLPFEKEPNSKKHSKSMSVSSSSVHSSEISSIMYKNKDRKRSESSFSSDGQFQSSSKLQYYFPTRSTLFDLYRSLCQGMPLEKWYEKNFNTISENNIDIRRFIKFGLVKKIIYRVFSHPVMSKRNLLDDKTVDDHTTFLLSTSDIKFDVGDKVLDSIYKKLSKVSFESDHIDKYSKSTDSDLALTERERIELLKSVENIDSFDKICVKLGKSRSEVEKLLYEIGDFKIINC